MSRLPSLLLVALAAPCAAQAQTSTPARVEYHAADALARTADSLRAANGVSKILGDHGAYFYVLVTRDRTGAPEQHAKWTDVMFMQAGTATVLLGGRYEGGTEEQPGEMRGGQLVGAAPQRVTVGDVIVIPAGMPHQVVLTPGSIVRYVTVKAPEPAAK